MTRYVCLAPYLPVLWYRHLLPPQETPCLIPGEQIQLTTSTISPEVDSLKTRARTVRAPCLPGLGDWFTDGRFPMQAYQNLPGTFFFFFNARTTAKKWSLLNEVIKLKGYEARPASSHAAHLAARPYN